jgi:hypothetical protein
MDLWLHRVLIGLGKLLKREALSGSMKLRRDMLMDVNKAGELRDILAWA